MCVCVYTYRLSDDGTRGLVARRRRTPRRQGHVLGARTFLCTFGPVDWEREKKKNCTYIFITAASSRSPPNARLRHVDGVSLGEIFSADRTEKTYVGTLYTQRTNTFNTLITATTRNINVSAAYTIIPCAKYRIKNKPVTLTGDSKRKPAPVARMLDQIAYCRYF